MKKIVLSLAAVAIVVSLASCKKTCNCKRWEASKVVEEKKEEPANEVQPEQPEEPKQEEIKELDYTSNQIEEKK